MSDQPAIRSRKPAKRQAALSMRIAPATRDQLVAIAKENGRSVTQEADRLLAQAMLVEKMAGGTKGWRIVFDILKIIDDIAWLGKGLDDPANYVLVMSYSILTLAKHFPEDPSDLSPYKREEWILSAIDDGREKVKEMLSGSEK